MKKLALSLAVLFSVALVSCGNKQAEATDSDTMAMDTVAVVEETVEATDSDTTVAVEAAAEVAPAEAAAETPAK